MSEEFNSNQPIKLWLPRQQSTAPTPTGSPTPPVPPSYYGTMPPMPQSPGPEFSAGSFISIPSGFALLKISWETKKELQQPRQNFQRRRQSDNRHQVKQN